MTPVSGCLVTVTPLLLWRVKACMAFVRWNFPNGTECCKAAAVKQQVLIFSDCWTENFNNFYYKHIVNVRLPCETCAYPGSIFLEMFVGLGYYNSDNICISQTPCGLQGKKTQIAQHRKLTAPAPTETSLQPPWGLSLSFLWPVALTIIPHCT